MPSTKDEDKDPGGRWVEDAKYRPWAEGQSGADGSHLYPAPLKSGYERLVSTKVGKGNRNAADGGAVSVFISS
jgi:hypothetical protein